MTGASQGIGLDTARLLAQRGAKVVLAARSRDTLKKVEREIPGSLAVTADMRNPDDVSALVKTTFDHFGRIDILVNNAGQGMYGPVESINIEEYKSIVELNVYGALRAMEAVIPIMKKQGGGMIVNVSSLVSKNYFPNLGAYASTKYALNALSLTAREELAKDRIMVSVMHPKMTATEFGANAFGAHPNFMDRAVNRKLQIDTPKQVAEKIIELIATEDAEATM